MAPKPSKRSQLKSNFGDFSNHPSNQRQAAPGPPPRRHGSPIVPSSYSASPPPHRSLPAGEARSPQSRRGSADEEDEVAAPPPTDHHQRNQALNNGRQHHAAVARDPSPEYGPAHEAMRRAMVRSRATPAINLLGTGTYLHQAFLEPLRIVRPVWFGGTDSGFEEMAASSYPSPRATTFPGMPSYPPIPLGDNQDIDDVESNALSPSPTAGAPASRLRPGFDITQSPSYFRGPSNPSGFVTVNVTVNAGNVPSSGPAPTGAKNQNAAASGGMTFALDPSALLGSANTSGGMPSTRRSTLEASGRRSEDTNTPDRRSARTPTGESAHKRRRMGEEETMPGEEPRTSRMPMGIGEPMTRRTDSPMTGLSAGDGAGERRGRNRARSGDGGDVNGEADQD